MKITYPFCVPICGSQLSRKISDNRFAVVGASFSMQLLFCNTPTQQPVAHHQRDVDGAPGGGLRAVDDRTCVGEDIR